MRASSIGRAAIAVGLAAVAGLGAVVGRRDDDGDLSLARALGAQQPVRRSGYRKGRRSSAVYVQRQGRLKAGNPAGSKLAEKARRGQIGMGKPR